MNSPVPCDYPELERRLRGGAAPMGPAEAHGFASGLVCGAVPHADRLWERELLGESDPNDVLAQECRRSLLALLAEVRRQLASEQFGYRLCLPPVDWPLEQRAAALRDWCRGFLYGFGLAGERWRDQLSDEAEEALHDLSAMTAMDAEAARGEADEEALAELEEYARVAALLVREQLLAEGQPRNA